MVNQLLKQLGFNDKDAEVYLAILQHGKISPASLAAVTNINRTTVYSITKELIKRGVISQDLSSPTQHLIALPPSDLENIISREEKKLEDKKLLVQEAISELKSLTKTAKYPVPKIVFITEDDLENYLYRQTPTWNKSLQEVSPTWWGFQDPSLVEHYQKWIDWYWQESKPENVDLKLLTSQADIEKTMEEQGYEKRHIKFWQESSSFTATTWINGDYVIMVMTSRKPHYLVEIHDKILAHNLRQVFKGIWRSI